MLDPTTVTMPETAVDDPRVGHLLGPDDDRVQVVLVGFPSDEGVRRNGGRPGAAQAPDAIRQALYKTTPDARDADTFTHLLARTADLGNVRVTGDVAADQVRLGAVLAPYLERGVVPIVLGGGHETSFGHFLGYVEAGRDVHILNWDAHPDVRALKDGQSHSGSPFRQALAHPSGRCRGYAVAGLAPHSVARAHLDYLDEAGAQVVWQSDVTHERVRTLYAERERSTLATFDMDAVDQAFAPGVSAPAARGLAPDLWLEAASRAGRCPHVTSFDLVEVNPRVDAEGRTVRLAALTVWHFLKGLSDRTAA
ncbi:MAG: arginase [Bacteroidetes bacterium]|jgi:formiminoglutamase|nr:arginase [Bacteroidota bacterium]